MVWVFMKNIIINFHTVWRAYDAFIEAIDFRDLGITLDPNKVGNSEYHPKAMWTAPLQLDTFSKK